MNASPHPVGRCFAREYWVVALTGRTAQRVEAEAGEIRAQGGQEIAAVGDVTSEKDLAHIANGLKNHGTLRSAIFNAGNAVRAPTLEPSLKQFEPAWRTSVLGGFVFARAALPLLLETPDTADKRSLIMPRPKSRCARSRAPERS